MLKTDSATAFKTGSPPGTSEPFFYSIMLSRQADGRFFIELTATYVDDAGPSLLYQEIASDSFVTIDDALALVRTRLHADCPVPN